MQLSTRKQRKAQRPTHIDATTETDPELLAAALAAEQTRAAEAAEDEQIAEALEREAAREAAALGATTRAELERDQALAAIDGLGPHDPIPFQVSAAGAAAIEAAADGQRVPCTNCGKPATHYASGGGFICYTCDDCKGDVDKPIAGEVAIEHTPDCGLMTHVGGSCNCGAPLAALLRGGLATYETVANAREQLRGYVELIADELEAMGSKWITESVQPHARRRHTLSYANEVVELAKRIRAELAEGDDHP